MKTKYTVVITTKSGKKQFVECQKANAMEKYNELKMKHKEKGYMVKLYEVKYSGPACYSRKLVAE